MQHARKIQPIAREAEQQFSALCESGFIFKKTERSVILKWQYKQSKAHFWMYLIHLYKLYIYDPGLYLLLLTDWEAEKTRIHPI